MRPIQRIAGACALLLFIGCASKTESSSATQARAAEAPSPGVLTPKPNPSSIGLKWNTDESGFVMHGYDPLSYLDGAPPVKGSGQFSHSWADVLWSFSSRDHLDTFKASPERYAPAVGGFCTFGVVIDKKFDGDPKVWMVQGGKVHLFLNEEVKAKFLQDQEGNLAKVANKWPYLQTKKPAEL